MVNLITQHIDIWTAAQEKKTNGSRGRGANSNGHSPHGIKKLRGLILELAVRGKLVPQDPTDEPVSVLLEKIAKEIARLTKEGKIKKQKPSPEITEDEKPFELPEGWKWVRLGEVGNIFNGNSISARAKEAKYKNIEGGLPFIATKDVGYGWEEFDYCNGVSIPKDEPKFKVAHKSSVLICAEGGSAGKKCGITNQDICFGNKLFANDLYGNIKSSYILANYLSPTFFYQFGNKMTGIIGGISAAKFNQLLLPIPPLAEQSRIVDKVDELMALCDQLEQKQTDSNAAHQTLVETLLATLTNAANQQEFAEAWQRIADHFDTLFTTEQSIDQLKQTILQLAVMGKLVPQDQNDEPVDQLLRRVFKERKLFKRTTANNIKVLSLESMKNFSIPKSWRWQTLDDLLIFGPKNGFSPKAVEYETDVRSLTLSATTSGQFKSEYFKFIEADIPPDSDLWLQDGDILVQRGNTIEYVGVSAVYHGASNQLIYPDLMMKLRVSNHIEVRFIHLVMLSKSSRDYLRARASGTSGTMPKINQATMKSLPIPVPSIAEQHRIVAKVEALMALCDMLKERLNDAQTTQIQLADTIVDQAVA